MQIIYCETRMIDPITNVNGNNSFSIMWVSIRPSTNKLYTDENL